MMTTSELDKLIGNAENGSPHALIDACEHLLDDYTNLRIRNLIHSCHTQLLKLKWTFIQKLAPDVLASYSSIRDRFIDTQATPSVTKLKDLFQHVTLTIQNSSSNTEYIQRLTVVFNRFGSLLPAIIDIHFKEYADISDVRNLVSKYNQEPSFHSYMMLIKGLLNLSSRIDERERYNRYFSNILSKWSDIETSADSISLINRCKKLAITLSRECELRFTQTQYSADKGNAIDIAGLGILYEQGIGVAKDDSMAKMLYMQALNAGYNEAQVYMDNLNQRIRHQDEQRTERIRIQTQLDIQKMEQELRRQDAENRARIESERLEEERRHHKEIENIELQKIEEDREKRYQAEAEMEENAKGKIVQVFLRYKLYSSNGYTHDGDMIREISQDTYNSLVAGGTQAVISFVKGQKGYMREGEYIMDASMSIL